MQIEYYRLAFRRRERHSRNLYREKCSSIWRNIMTNLLLNHQWRLAPRMPAIRKLTFFIAFAFFPLISRAENLTLPGIFTADDNVQLFSVSLAAPAAVDIRSY